jgi:putative heme-binding domain-containing protein
MTKTGIVAVCLVVTLVRLAGAQQLEPELLAEGAGAVAAAARQQGDAQRGAVVFFQPYLACSKCHVSGKQAETLGPDLARIGKDVTDAQLVEAVLEPSKVIRKGFEPVSIVTTSGRSITGLLAEESPERVVLRDPAQDGKPVAILKRDIEERTAGKVSIMPAGQVNQLTSRQQFLDLIRYLIEIRDGGPLRAKELEPPASLFVLQIPEYEQHIDHAGMISSLDRKSFVRGEAIYQRLCINCHGTHDQPGSLPTSLRFASGRFKNGSDPFAIYQTLTRGFGLMAPQTWMVPQQKYDVIHYLREAYLKEHNPSQYASIDGAYLARLPKGNTRGPEPSKIEPWVVMNYGPSLINTYEVPTESRPQNLAYKGIAMRLDSGPGGVSRGRQWMMFDHDTLRMAAAWNGEGFIDWNGIHFNGRHQVHPRLAGDVAFANPVGPGWANPETGTFDDPRLRGRDGKPYGPLPRAWAHYRGLYHFGQRTIVSYTVGETDVLEMAGTVPVAAARPDEVTNGDTARSERVVFTRTFNLGPRSADMILQVAQHAHPAAAIQTIGPALMLGLADQSPSGGFVVAGLAPDVKGAEWQLAPNGQLRLKISRSAEPLRFTLWTAHTETADEARSLVASVRIDGPDQDLTAFTHGGPARWPEKLTTPVISGPDDGPFAVDVLSPPVTNPWLCQMRLTGFDFIPDGRRIAVCSWDGDVWIAKRGQVHFPAAEQKQNGQVNSPEYGPVPVPSGPARQAGPALEWQRIASGLFQPLGLKIVDGTIYVTCRDQIVILRDLNGDGETDFYENFNNDHQVTEHFHEFAMGLQTDRDGNFYYAKSARHALPAIVPHHGTLLRVSKDGSRTEILANGFRAANGVCLNPDGTFIVTDQEGHWNPKNRINWVKPGGFYGNMFGYHDVTDSSDSAMEQPLCWITNAFDRSPAELLWVDSDRWGPLKGSLLNLSYGNGKVFVVPHETVNGMHQGGMSPLPLPAFPTGIMRGRFHPTEGQLYVCGMFAWAGSATQPGGFYRIRRTDKPVHVPLELHARKGKLEIKFSGPLDPDSVRDVANFAMKTWSLKRTAKYGSEHYDEKRLEIRSANLSRDGQTVVLDIPDLHPTWCAELRYALKGTNGEPVESLIHHTIHALAE